VPTLGGREKGIPEMSPKCQVDIIGKGGQERAPWRKSTLQKISELLARND
jgi:hypothetical protein